MRTTWFLETQSLLTSEQLERQLVLQGPAQDSCSQASYLPSSQASSTVLSK